MPDPDREDVNNGTDHSLAAQVLNAHCSGDELANVSFASLQPGKRSIKSSTIIRKWSCATAAGQANVKAMLVSVQNQASRQSRQHLESDSGSHAAVRSLNQMCYHSTFPTILTLNDSNVDCSLQKRLPRMPFPPNTKEWHFDYEEILKRNVRGFLFRE